MGFNMNENSFETLGSLGIKFPNFHTYLEFFFNATLKHNRKNWKQKYKCLKHNNFFYSINLIQVQIHRLNHPQSETINMKDDIIQVHILYNVNTYRV